MTVTNVDGRVVLDSAAMEALRIRLEQERDHLLEQAGLTTEDLIDPEDPSLGHDAVAAALETMTRTGLADVTGALARMEAGIYGNCLGCQTPIPPERLDVMPATEFCVSCQQRNE